MPSENSGASNEVKGWIEALKRSRTRMESVPGEEIKRFQALISGLGKVNSAVSNDLKRLKAQGKKPSKENVAFDYIS